MSQAERFITTAPSLESYFRGVILFGKNTASYKFALAKALLAVPPTAGEVIPLEALALPFAQQVCEHLQGCDAQTTQRSSRFLESCRQFNRGEIDAEALKAATIKDGFTYVLDAFHRIGDADIPRRFFQAQGSGSERSLRFTEELLELRSTPAGVALPSEVESRWRLVEHSWQLKLPDSVLTVRYDHDLEQLFANRPDRRPAITGVRPAIIGYQKAACFYCFRSLTDAGGNTATDVDHFLPRILMVRDIIRGLDGVWNLVLACKDCNRGEGGKFAARPVERLLYRLHARNEFLIGSDHPLKPTLIAQTGESEQRRRHFLQAAYNAAGILPPWQPNDAGSPLF